MRSLGAAAPSPPSPPPSPAPPAAQPPPTTTTTTRRPPSRASSLPTRRLQHLSPPAAPPVPPNPKFVRFGEGDKGKAKGSKTNPPSTPSTRLRTLTYTRTTTKTATETASSAGDKTGLPSPLLPPTPPVTPRLPRLRQYPRPWTLRKNTATPPTPTSPTTSTLTARSSPSCSTRTAAATTTTTTASRRIPQRPPLAAGESNVPLTTMRNLTTAPRTPRDAAAAATTTTTTTTPKMAPDKHKQPQLPTLAKGLTTNRPPLTPKVAGSARAANAPHHHQTVTVATPLPRRPPARPDSSLGGTAYHREDRASPASNFLASNVTPRSGTRQGRVDSTNTTPNGTPSLERSLADAWDGRTGPSISGGPDSGSDSGFRTRSTVGLSPPASDARQDHHQPPSSTDSKFIYASDARSLQSLLTSASQPKPAQPKGATFFYANGENLPGRPNTASASPLAPVLAPPAQQPDGRSTTSSKFIYANGTPDLKPSLKSPSGPPSVVSTAPKMARAAAAAGPSPAYAAQRPASPVKLPSYSSTAKSCAATSPALAPNPAGLASAAPLTTTTPSTNRRISGGSLPSRGHSRGNSLTMADTPSVARILASTSSPEASSPAPGATQSTPALTMASILQAADDFASSDGHHHDGDLVGSPPPEGLASPTKSAFGGSSAANDPLNDLVATARRDRKVQDLEIRNASLEAINRTLERQLRKQTAEVRRFRRLSRAGRLSLASAEPSTRRSTRIPSDSTVGSNVELMRMSELGLSDLSEEEHDSYFDDDDGDDDFSASPSGSESELGQPSPTPAAAAASASDRGARHRQRDERRLQLDLSKHQQLLVDSQKINQSLKRCLGWTEELIREGRRALDYQVRVSDVEIGGRVLPAPDDEEDDDVDGEGAEEEDPPPYDGEDGDGDDTIRIEVNGEPAAVFVVSEGKSSGRSSPLSGRKDPQDRDSGIELPREGG